MALNNNKDNNGTKKVFATDEDGMMRDAKEYASRDYKQTLDVFRKAGVTTEQCTDEVVAKSLILVKLKQIKDSRLNRVTFFD